MFRRSIFDIAICVLVTAPTVWSVASGDVKAGGKVKGDKAAKAGSEGTDSGGPAKGEAAKGQSAEKSADPKSTDKADAESDEGLKPVPKTDREWRRLLSPKEYRVTRQKETELPFSGKYVHNKKEGVYRCLCCGAKLFGSDTKFDSGTGWPSFYAPLKEKAIATAADYSDGTARVEVTCSRCGAHLGHVFGDGPAPTGLRYCINSVALKLQESPKPGGATSGKSKATSDSKKPSRDK